MKTQRGTLVFFLMLAIALRLQAADDLETKVARMAKIGFVSSPSFSPDATRVAFLSNLSGSPQVWIVSSAGGWPDQVTAFDDPVNAVSWSPDGRWLALQVAPGGGLNERIELVRPDGTELRQLTPPGKVTNWLGRWSRDGKFLTIASNQRSADAMDDYVIDAGSGAMRLVTRNKGIGTYSDISRDGRYAILNRLISRGDNDVYRVDLQDGSEVLLSRHTPPGTFGALFGRDSDTIWILSNKGRDLIALGRVTIREGKAGEIENIMSRDDAELDSLSIDEAGRRALLTWNVAGRSELSLIDLVSGKEIARPKLPQELVGDADLSRDGKLVAATLSGATAPSDLWVARTDSLDFKQVTRSPHAGVDLSALVRPELIQYSAADGVKLSGWLYRPRSGSAPWPTVFSYHGGPEGQARPSFNSQVQALAGEGFAVFLPNVRGSAGFGKAFVNLDNGALRVNGVKDIKASADALVSRGIADRKRLGIMGGSYGGYMVMAGVTEYPDLFKAGADLFGVVNFETFFAQSEPWMAAISTIEYGDPKTQQKMLYELSPIHKLDRVTASMIVIHGANDTNVPVVEAEQVVSGLKGRNVPVEYILFPDEGHGWRKTPNRIRSAVAITRFFAEKLK